MITAKEAKIKTDKTIIKWKENSWHVIRENIEDAIKNGKYSIRLILSENEHDQLIELGYTLSHIGNSDSATYDIFWN